MTKKIINGYKGFDKNLTCKGKKYEIGKTYTEAEAELCKKGMPPTIMKKIKTYHKPQIEIISIPTIRIMTASCEMRPGHGYGDKNHGHAQDKWEEDHGESYKKWYSGEYQQTEIKFDF